MRARLVIVSALVVAFPVTAGALLAPAHAQPLQVAQEEEGDQGETSEQRPAQPSSPAPSPTTEEAGPPWTYQMARISILLLALMLLAVGATYYRLVLKRQRGAA